MEKSVTRQRAGVAQQICGLVIAFAVVLSLFSLIMSYVDYDYWLKKRDFYQILILCFRVLSYGALILLVSNRTMKVGFSLLVLSYIPDALINIFKVVTDPVMTCSLDILFWLLFFAGLVTVCVGGDIRSRYPRLSATYLFLFGSWGVARLIYRFVSVDLTTGDHSLIWFVDRDNMFLWVDCAYSVARWIVAIAFWISVLKWNYPDDKRPIVNPATQPVVISAVAVTAICAIVLNFILPDVL